MRRRRRGGKYLDGRTGYTVPVLAQKVHAPARCDSVQYYGNIFNG